MPVQSALICLRTEPSSGHSITAHQIISLLEQSQEPQRVELLVSYVPIREGYETVHVDWIDVSTGIRVEGFQPKSVSLQAGGRGPFVGPLDLFLQTPQVGPHAIHVSVETMTDPPSVPEIQVILLVPVIRPSETFLNDERTIEAG